MRSFTAICSPTYFPPPRGTAVSLSCFSSSRTQIAFTKRVFYCQAKYAESEINETFSLKVVPPTLLAAEKEEAKAVLTLFLKKQGMSNAMASRTINKSDSFIGHLVSRLHSVHKARYLVGRELTTLEIREALIPYLETLLEEHGSILVDVVESFPNPPVKEKPAAISASAPDIDGEDYDEDTSTNERQQKALSRVSETDPDGNLRPNILYLQELGLDLDQIKGITRRFPYFPYYSLEGKLKPVVEFLVDLGIPRSDIPVVLNKRPQLCGISLHENIIPTMAFLEGFGVDKTQWAKVIYRFPALLTYSRQKMKASVDFLSGLGLTEQGIGRVLTRWPNIVSYSVDDKLQPTVEYFRALGVDVSVLILRAPQTFGLSVEANLKPVTEFFLAKGYTEEEIKTMVSRYGALYTFSLKENMVPKWEFYLEMGYPKSDIVKFPQYFGYSLEERIKPRHAVVKELGVSLLLNQLLSLSGPNFEKALKAKLKKHNGQGS